VEEEAAFENPWRSWFLWLMIQKRGVANL
jgi:hypothetical protein